MLAELRKERAKDRQVFAFRYGPYWLTGLVSDVHTNPDLIERVDKDGIALSRDSVRRSIPAFVLSQDDARPDFTGVCEGRLQLACR
jgi:hypothetical protein